MKINKIEIKFNIKEEIEKKEIMMTELMKEIVKSNKKFRYTNLERITFLKELLEQELYLILAKNENILLSKNLKITIEGDQNE